MSGRTPPALGWSTTWASPALVLRDVAPGARVLTIIEGGDATMSLLAAGAVVTAVSPDVDQRALLHLQLAAARALPPQSVRALLGMDAAGRRVWFYHYVREHLPDEARRWWDAHESVVRLGIWNAGAREARIVADAAGLGRPGLAGRAYRAVWGRTGDPWRRALVGAWDNVRPALAPLLTNTPFVWPWLNAPALAACRAGQIDVVAEPPSDRRFDLAIAGSNTAALPRLSAVATIVRAWSDVPGGERDPASPFAPWLREIRGQAPE